MATALEISWFPLRLAVLSKVRFERNDYFFATGVTA
jgi:hypothetical protein